MSGLACTHCGSDKGFRALGTVTCSASQEVTVERGEDGKLKAKLTGFVDTDTFDADAVEVDRYRCRECGAEDYPIEKLIGGPPYEAGATVTLPDGLRGTVESVDRVARRIKVVNWHETFRFDEVSLLEPSIMGGTRIAE